MILCLQPPATLPGACVGPLHDTVNCCRREQAFVGRGAPGAAVGGNAEAGAAQPVGAATEAAPPRPLLATVQAYMDRLGSTAGRRSALRPLMSSTATVLPEGEPAAATPPLRKPIYTPMPPTPPPPHPPPARLPPLRSGSGPAPVVARKGERGGRVKTRAELSSRKAVSPFPLAQPLVPCRLCSAAAQPTTNVS